MQVYVTGASGFVGRHVARALRERGADVREERIDLLDTPRLEQALGGCDALVHVAALYSYDADERLLARACKEEGPEGVVPGAVATLRRARGGVAQLVRALHS